MDELHNWLFHYNPYTKVWAAFRREDLNAHFNGDTSKDLVAEKHTTLVEILILTQGDPKKIKALVDHGTKFAKKVSKG